MVDYEHFTVWSFHGEGKASSFRTPLPSRRFQECLKEVMERDRPDYLLWSGSTKKGGVSDTGQSRRGTNDGESAEEGGKGPSKEDIAKMGKEEQRRLRKRQRMIEVSMILLPLLWQMIKVRIKAGFPPFFENG